MNFKKLSVIAFAVASFAAHADNLIADMTALDIETNKPLLVAGAVPDAGNASYILQESTGAIAYIIQSGIADNGNLAAVMQGDDQSLAIVYQTGGGNKAVISTAFGTTGAGDTGTRAGVDVTVSADAGALADVITAELADAPANGFSEISNVALITQSTEGAFTNTAYIDITGTLNFAAISQTAATASNMAAIVQVGSLNRAAIIQSN